MMKPTEQSCCAQIISMGFSIRESNMDCFGKFYLISLLFHFFREALGFLDFYSGRYYPWVTGAFTQVVII